MNFREIVNSFSDINGVKSVGIIENIENPKEIYSSNSSHDGFQKTLEDLSHIVRERILNLTLSSFFFKKSSVSYVAYIESSMMILLEYDNSVNFNLLKSKIDEFRNKVLISF